ncbi:hypothetical protein TNCV_1725361 [Trichonephila clavipes]|nr:hypothetical protein TNCV_1725361 [Trichonephila clavipes]
MQLTGDMVGNEVYNYQFSTYKIGIAKMPKRKRVFTTDEIQKVLVDLEDEIFDDSDSDCELENEEDDLISAQQK